MRSLAGVAGLLALGAAAAPDAPRAAAALRIVSDRVLPPGISNTFDVRWASDRTVYLPLVRDGTVEAAVDPGGPAPREMIPGSMTVGGWSFSSLLGASPNYLVVAGQFFGITWRALAGDKPLRQEQRWDKVQDIDVAGNRLLVLGARKDEHGNYAPDGTIAWIGSLDKGLTDLRSVLLDARGSGAPNLTNCWLFENGAVRFLADGSFIVVPGVQPGAYLYDSNARLVRTWDTPSLGIDTDCASLSDEQARRLAIDFDARVAWLNQRRTLDEILPLQQGPGLVIRSVLNDRTRWQLKVLRQSGGVATYEIPVEPESARSHLRGDVRGGRIALVLSTFQQKMGTLQRPASRLILAEVPER